jgi:predicted MPP superfamily phosphohydrolase
MFHNGNIDAIQQNAAKVFHKIISKAGQWFFVLWNHDYYAEGESEKIIHLLDSVWYKNSTNTYYEITENGQKIGIAGLDDYKLWTPNTDKINIDTTGKTFNVMLEHNLDGYNPVQEKHSYVDLVLSGHTHSGEIEWWFVNATALIKWYENKNKQLTGRKRLLPTNTISYISPGFSTINPLGVRLGTNTAGATAIEFKKIQQ